MKLRALVENNSDLEDKINLQYYDKKGVPYLVSWKMLLLSDDTTV